MSDPSPGFFPQRAELYVQEYFLTDFPFPLALTYHRLLAGLERQEPVEAAWLLRDAFEATMKFVAAVATADLLQARPDPAAIQKVASLLLKPTGLSTGDWHSAMTLPLEAAAADRLLPELKTIFYDSQGDATELNLLLDGSEESFVAWRNRNIGHGVFRQDRAWYAKETLRWLPVLHNLYAALRPVLTPWTLVGETMGQEQVVWHGVRAEELHPREVHEHEAWGEVLPLFLVREGQRLPLGPLLSIQQCRYCYHPIPFFFDKFKKGKADTTVFGEYLYGQDAAQQDWEGTRTLQTHLPETYRFKATFWEIMAIRRLQDITFRDFEHEYLRPNYLIEAIHRQVRESTKGCLHLIGSEGMGKTFLARGLGAETPPLGCVYLVYHILPGALTDHQTFISEIKKLAESKLPMGRVEAQLNFDDRKGLKKEFGSYLNGLKTQNKLKRLVLVIDGLDELPDPPEKSAAITDLLPAAGTLPDGVFIVLTSREALRPQIAADLRRLHSGPANQALFTTRVLRPEDAENQSLLRAYIEKNLLERFRDPNSVETVLRLSGGVFLYAFHLCRAIASRAFPDLESLPLPGQFYPAYLDRLRSQVGAAEFESKYLRALLLLCAARIPVSLETLEGWGAPKGALNDILPDIKDFLHIHRGPRWQDTLTDEDDGEPRFEMAHAAFVRYVQEDAVLAPKLIKAHKSILASGLARAKRAGGWDKLALETEATLYLLRFALLHRDEAGLETTIPVVELHALGQTAFNAGTTALAKARYLLALDLFGSQERILRHIAHDQPELEDALDLSNDLASALVNKGVSLRNLTRLEEALLCYEEAILILWELVKTRPELRNDLASALMNKGNSLQNLARYDEALLCYEEAILILWELVKTRPELRNDLAMALMNKGNSLQNLARYDEALLCYEEAILIRRELVKTRPELRNDLAMALVNKGVSLRNLTRLEEALLCYEEAILILWELVKTRPELRNDLASALMNKGNSLQNLARYDEALLCYEEAILIRRELVKTRPELRNDLAMALVNKGVSLQNLARYDEALLCYEEAILILWELVKTRPELRNDLASALMNKGVSLQNLARYDEALLCYEEAILILWELVKTRPELRNDLAMALMNKGNSLQNLARYDEALLCYEEAILILWELVKTRPELRNDLAMALVNKGVSLQNLARYDEALLCYEEAILILWELVKTRPELRNDLASALVNKGNALQASGKRLWQDGSEAEATAVFQSALDCCNEGIEVWEKAIQEQNAHFLIPNYIKGLRIRFDLFVSFNLRDSAANDVLRAFNAALPYLGPESPMPAIKPAFIQFLRSIRALASEQRASLDDALGEQNAAIVRHYTDTLE